MEQDGGKKTAPVRLFLGENFQVASINSEYFFPLIQKACVM
jgi:hypothetical protein